MSWAWGMLVILLIISTVVLRSSIALTRGSRVSAVVVRTPAIRAARTMCVLFGLFSYLIIYQFSEAVSQTPFKKITMVA